jgi:hypothetical protein
MFDTSGLTPASTKANLRWRDTSLTFIWLRDGAPIEAAHRLEDKRRVVSECSSEERILAVRPVQYPNRQQVLVVDDLEAVRQALAST